MGTMARLVMAGFILTATSVPTYASGRASFDCAVAKTPIERLICTNGQLGDLDLEMGYAFDQGRRQGTYGSLTADQRDWLKKRLAACSIPAKGEVKAAAAREMVTCLIKMYEERIRFLSGEVLGDDPVCTIVDAHLQGQGLGPLPDEYAAPWKPSELDHTWFPPLNEADIPWRGGTTRAYSVGYCSAGGDCAYATVIDTEPHHPPVDKPDRILDGAFHREDDRFRRPIWLDHDGAENIYIINGKTVLTLLPPIFDGDYAYARYYEIQTGHLQKLCVAFSPRRTGRVPNQDQRE